MIGGNKSGRASFQVQYPQIFSKVKEILEGLRGAELPVNVPIARNVIIGVIRQMNPEILETIQNQQTGAKIKISLSMVQ